MEPITNSIHRLLSVFSCYQQNTSENKFVGYFSSVTTTMVEMSSISLVSVELLMVFLFQFLFCYRPTSFVSNKHDGFTDDW